MNVENCLKLVGGGRSTCSAAEHGSDRQYAVANEVVAARRHKSDLKAERRKLRRRSANAMFHPATSNLATLALASSSVCSCALSGVAFLLVHVISE